MLPAKFVVSKPCHERIKRKTPSPPGKGYTETSEVKAGSTPRASRPSKPGRISATCLLPVSRDLHTPYKGRMRNLPRTAPSRTPPESLNSARTVCTEQNEENPCLKHAATAMATGCTPVGALCAPVTAGFRRPDGYSGLPVRPPIGSYSRDQAGGTRNRLCLPRRTPAGPKPPTGTCPLEVDHKEASMATD